MVAAQATEFGEQRFGILIEPNVPVRDLLVAGAESASAVFQQQSPQRIRELVVLPVLRHARPTGQRDCRWVVQNERRIRLRSKNHVVCRNS
jgi:hypothetical protein